MGNRIEIVEPTVCTIGTRAALTLWRVEYTLTLENPQAQHGHALMSDCFWLRMKLNSWRCRRSDVFWALAADIRRHPSVCSCVDSSPGYAAPARHWPSLSAASSAIIPMPNSTFLDSEGERHMGKLEAFWRLRGRSVVLRAGSRMERDWPQGLNANGHRLKPMAIYHSSLGERN